MKAWRRPTAFGGVFMKNQLVAGLSCVLLCGVASADSSGSDWSGSYGFPGSAKHQTNMTQADLIAKREAGYYDGLGKTQVYNISTTTIGTMNTMNTTIDGENNTVASDSYSSGNLDASVAIQSSKSATLAPVDRR